MIEGVLLGPFYKTYKFPGDKRVTRAADPATYEEMRRKDRGGSGDGARFSRRCPVVSLTVTVKTSALTIDRCWKRAGRGIGHLPRVHFETRTVELRTLLPVR